MADSRDLLFNLLGKETVSTAAKKAERSLEDLGDEFKDAGRAADKLDREISDVERSLKTLAVAFAHTGDNKFADKIRENERELRKLKKTSKLISGDGKSIGAGLAEEVTVGFGAKFGPLFMRVVPQSLAKLGPVGGIIGGLIAVQAAAIIGASVSAAVVGGAGALGIAGGLALAAKDSRVQANAKSLASEISGDLEIGAKSFVGPAMKGLDILRDGWRNVRGDVDKIFASTSRFVIPLARGLSAMFQNIVPGVRKAAEAAGPIFREIGDGLPRLGRAIGDLFSNLSKHAGEGASAVRLLFNMFEGGIRTISFVVGALSNLYRGLVEVNDVAATVAENIWGRFPIIGDKVKEAATRAHELKAALDDSNNSGEGWGDELYKNIQKVTTQTQSATDAIKDYRAELQTAANANITADQAMIDLEASIDNATQSLKENGKTLDINTPKGRANASALNDIATKANTASDAIYDQTGNQKDANAAAERGRQKFIELAVKMGMARDEAIKLAQTKIPDKTVRVTVLTEKALRAISAVQQSLGKLHDYHFGVYYTPHTGNLKLPGGTSIKGSRWGGVYEKAAVGTLREASTYSATNPGRYMIAEPSTGGEAFIPKNGNAKRSAAILQKAASWYGMSVGRPGGGSGEQTVRLIIEGTGVLAGLRKEVRVRGGNVQMVLGT